jgi:hypothetical protein
MRRIAASGDLLRGRAPERASNAAVGPGRRPKRRSAVTDVPAAAPCWTHVAAIPRSIAFPETPMLYTIAIVLLILWVLGMVTAYTAGGLLHLLLVIAVVMIVYQLITGRRVP